MDSFIKLGQQAYQQYSDNNNQSHGGHTDRPTGGGDVNVMGGAHLNRPAGGQMIDTDGDGIPDIDQAAAHASGHSGSSGDASLFKTAANFLKSQSHKEEEEDVDESRATDAHDRAYNQNQGSTLDAKSMGIAAALQAFKQFNNNNNSYNNNKATGKEDQSQLLGLAMAQAAKLFDSSGGASGGQKQDAVNSAGKMVMKLMMKQKLQSAGGGSGGGLGGLASLIGKFA